MPVSRKTLVVGGLSAAVMLALIILWRLLSPESHRDHVHRGQEGQEQSFAELSPQQSPGVELGQTVYTCSMHPQVRSTDPDARCPICGMALIPRSEERRVGKECESRSEAAE